MENIKSNNEQSFTQQSLITMDDLFIQIGKLHIDKINSDKIAVLLSEQVNKYKDIADKKTETADYVKTASENELSAINKRLVSLEGSNKLYQKNNGELAKKIQELSAIIEKKTAEIEMLASQNKKKRVIKK